jgi:hypothetical protein
MPAKRPMLTRVCSAALFATLGLALLHAMFYEVEPQSPLREVLNGHAARPSAPVQLAGEIQKFANAADGGNRALHFDGFGPQDPLLSILTSQVYFRFAYDLFPHRLVVGNGEHIINTPVDLHAADVLQTDRWLRQHDVRALLTIHRTADGLPSFDVRKLD